MYENFPNIMCLTDIYLTHFHDEHVKDITCTEAVELVISMHNHFLVFEMLVIYDKMFIQIFSQSNA